MRGSRSEPLWRQDDPDDGYTRLAKAIIAHAADSLTRAVYTVGIVDILMIEGPHLRNMMTHYNGALGAISENEHFFRSDWYHMLAVNSGFMMEGENAIEACQKKAYQWIHDDLQLDTKKLQKKYVSHRYRYR